MKILWKYLWIRLTTTLLALLTIFSLIITVWDISERLSIFHDEGIPVSKAITDYYIYFTPFFLIMIFPLLVFMSTLFTISRLAQRWEIIALYNGGISFNQILTPILLWGTLLSFLQLLFSHLVQPAFADKKIEFEQTRLGWYLPTRTSIILRLGENTTMWLNEFDSEKKRGYTVLMDRFSGNKLEERLRANQLIWIDSPNYWLLVNVSHWKWSENHYDVFKYDTLPVYLNITPSELKEVAEFIDELKTSELQDLIQKERAKGSSYVRELEAKLHERWASSVVLLILVLMGARIGSRKTRGGTGWHIALGLLFGFGYVFLARVCLMIILSSSLPAFTGVWIPVLIYAIITALVYKLRM